MSRPNSPTPQRSRPRRRRQLIRVTETVKSSTGFERFRRAMQGSGFSAVVSVAAHVLLLLLLTWFVVRGEGLLKAEPLDLRWLTAREVEEGQSARAPVRIASIPDGTPTVPVVPETPEPPMPARPARPAVQPVDVAGQLATRKPEKKRLLLQRIDEGGKSDLAVRSALGWFARQQLPTGNWRLHEGYPDAGRRTARTDTGATALALLSFLGAGFDHVSGEHQKTVAGGINWLVGQQRPDGNLFDIDEFGREETYYAHAMATIALCEAVALTADRRASQAATRAVKFLVASQQPIQGGWKYQPQTPLTNGDLSVTGWALMALHSARIAGIEVPGDAFLLASNFLDTVEIQDGARYRYEPEFPVTPAMTAEGLLCRQWLGWPRDHPQLENGVGYLLGPKHRPRWQDGRRNVYSWYYTAQVLHNMGGPEWEQWYRDARDQIASHQLRTGSVRRGSDVRGSWHPGQPIGQAAEKSDIAGRLYLTAMCVLVLETPYRHAGLYMPVDESEKGKPESGSTGKPDPKR
ncbi:MAG: terpene cyclase/mutase family protein [Planctomycetaceae bacterium]|nr:terpene cyclase/mutase family protein [Planctomycetaceae bacterium]